MVRTGQESSTLLRTDGADPDALKVTITDPEGKIVQFKSVRTNSGDEEIRWTPRVNGPHQIRAVLNGQSLPGFPATETAFDPAAVTVAMKTEAASVGHPIIFEADSYAAGGTQLTATARHIRSGRSYAVQCSTKSPFIHLLTFTPTQIGEHELQLFLNGLTVTHKLKFTVNNSEIDAEIVSQNGDVADDAEDVAEAIGAVYRSQIQVNADLDQLDFNLPVADYSPTSTLRSRVSVSSQQQQQQLPVEVKLPRHVPIHETIEFVINGVPANAQFAVHVQNPMGQRERCDNRQQQQQQQQNRQFVTFTPRLSGAHRFFVEVNNRYVSDLDQPPFCLVFDWTKITTKMKSPVGFLDEPFVLEVDASKCGGGAVECRVKLQRVYAASSDNADAASIASAFSESQPPADRQFGSLILTKPDDRYIISFKPDKAGLYELHVTYDGHPISSLPFIAPVVDFNSIRLIIQGLQSSPLSSVAWYRIELENGPSEHLSITVTNPKGASVDCTLTRWNQGLMCEWTAEFVGVYHLQVFIGDRQISTDDLTCHVYDINKVQVVQYDKVGLCKQPMKFLIEAEGASGNGRSEIAAFVLPLSEWKAAQESGVDLLAADGAGLPLRVQQLRDRRLQYEFVPQEGQQHVIEVYFNEQVLPQCPIMVYIFSEMDVLNQMKLPTAPWVPVRQICELRFRANFEQFSLPIDNKALGVVVRDPNSSTLANKTLANKEQFVIAFTPMTPGQQSLDVSYRGQQVRWSPFQVNAYDPDGLRVTFEPKVTIARSAAIEVDFSAAGEAPLQLRVEPPSGSHLAVQDNFQQQGIATFEYVPSEIGLHQLTLLFNGVEVEGSPFQQLAQSAEMAVAHGEGLVEAIVGMPAQFFVDPKGQRGDLLVQVDGPSSILNCEVTPQDNGLYSILYNPAEVGRYSVSVHWNSESIPGSPFAPLVVDPLAVRCVAGGPVNEGSSQLEDLIVGKERTIVYDCSRAGPGRLSASVDGPSDPVACHHSGDTISFTPAAAGMHHVSVWFGGHAVAGSPYVGNAVPLEARSDHTKVVISGRGLREARVKEMAHFLIDGSQAGAGYPTVNLVNSADSKKVNVHVHKMQDDKYKCTYTAMQGGNYQLHLDWSNRPLRGSPFNVLVCSISDAIRVVCSGEGLRQGVVGQEMLAEVDTRRAGDGELSASCSGPTRAAGCDVHDRGNGTFSIRVLPLEAGIHSLTVLFNGEHVPGSPFAPRVSPPPDASRVRVVGPGIQHGVIDDFVGQFFCETQGAGPGQLTIRVRGPRGAFRVEMEREYQKDRTINCRYDPREAGEYELQVKWSGVHVPGSPFTVNIFNSRQELDAFLRRNPSSAMAFRSANGDPPSDY